LGGVVSFAVRSLGRLCVRAGGSIVWPVVKVFGFPAHRIAWAPFITSGQRSRFRGSIIAAVGHRDRHRWRCDPVAWHSFTWAGFAAFEVRSPKRRRVEALGSIIPGVVM